MNITIPKNATKEQAFIIIEDFLKDRSLPVATRDNTRPWGGFFCIADSATQEFIDCFFHDIPNSQVNIGAKLSPKILLVQAGKRLSWQYHHRRAEIWKVIGGDVQVVVSDTDHQPAPVIKRPGDVIILKQGERHRLIGGDGWGVIAEIWQHVEAAKPSDEDDIVRVEDDFGR